MQVDTSFGGAASLWQLVRLSYALLQSPLLAQTPRGNPHPDLRSVTHHLWEALPPNLLSCAVYPRLSSYRDPDTLVYPPSPTPGLHPPHSLPCHRASVSTTDCNI